jgi:N6-L-threonylcarbamoyladenine synthase
MNILGIETSCDETSVAIVSGEKYPIILSNIVASSISLHAQTGGVIPENAAREQIKYMLPVIKEALSTAFGTNDTLDALKKIDAIAVTYGPGLIGSLLVGVETAKTIGFVLNKPLIPINHMVGHIYANFIGIKSKVKSQKSNLAPSPYHLSPNIEFPAIALVISGGHTDLLLLKGHGDLKLLGGTRDDAAGEAFDKIGRLLGLAYPAGPIIEQLAKDGDPKKFQFPRPLVGSPDYDFSFSGLKAAVLREVKSINKLDNQTVRDIARATQDAIIDVVIKKTIKAAQEYKAKSILISGGVAANQTLTEEFKIQSSKFKIKFFAPSAQLCTDNAAMIASAAFYNYDPVPWHEVSANPQLYFD